MLNIQSLGTGRQGEPVNEDQAAKKVRLQVQRRRNREIHGDGEFIDINEPKTVDLTGGSLSNPPESAQRPV